MRPLAATCNPRSPAFSYPTRRPGGWNPYRLPPDTTPVADALVDVVVAPPRGSVLVGGVDVVVDDVVAVPLVFFFVPGLTFGMVVVVVVVEPVVAFSTS